MVDQDLVDAVSNRIDAEAYALNETVVDQYWLEQAYAEAMAYIRMIAPGKKLEWLEYADLPTDVQTILIAALLRKHSNPRGIRQESIGEYSYTISSDAVRVDAGPFSYSEVKLIKFAAGAGTSMSSVTMLLPPVLPFAMPDAEIPYDPPVEY